MGKKSYTLKQNLADQLERVASMSHTSAEEHLAAAVESYIGLYEWQAEGVRQARAQLDRGEGIPHEQVMAEIRQMIAKAGA